MSDERVSPKVPNLFQGISRQPARSRAAGQLEDLVNMLPSVDLGGTMTRPSTLLLTTLTGADYLVGNHHLFRTTDGQRWILLRKVATGDFSVINADSGAEATLTMHPVAAAYLSPVTGGVRYLSTADTTIILNPEKVVQCVEVPKPALSAVYIVIRSTSSASQKWTVSKTDGTTAIYTSPKDNTETREDVATKLMTAMSAKGFVCYQVSQAPHIIKITGDGLETISATNSWSASAIQCIKGRVSAASDLTSPFEHGAVLAVDGGYGDDGLTYYVRYDRETNAWLETSYLQNDQVTTTWKPETMPVLLKQVGDAAFTLNPAPWVNRVKGSPKVAPLPHFVGKKITDIAVWKGRLIFASEDVLSMSRPDDWFNFFRETGRETRASDPIKLPAEAPNLTVIHHVVPFRNKLIVTADNAQLEVPGDKPITSADVTMGVATRYAIDKDCRPAVVGDSLYYAGPVAGRSALWEYYYEDSSAGNTAFDLTKHVPGLIKDRFQIIDGSAQAGRVYAWTPSDPAAVYCHSSFWDGGQRVQNAWSRLAFRCLDAIENLWVMDGYLILVGRAGGTLIVLVMAVEAGIDQTMPTDPMVDMIVWPQLIFKPGFTKVFVPTFMRQFAASLVFCAWDGQSEWWTEYTGNLKDDGYLYVPEAMDPARIAASVLGVRMDQTVVFSPFFMRDENGRVVAGRFQVHKARLELAMAGDFTATVTRPDRATPATVSRTARTIGTASAQPILGKDLVQEVPINSPGEKVRLAVATQSTAPMLITGYSLVGRHTNTDTEP